MVQAEYEKERFKLPSSLMQAAREDGAGPEPPKKKRRMGGSTATGPVKEEDATEKVVLWRVNRDEFNKRLRFPLLTHLPHVNGVAFVHPAQNLLYKLLCSGLSQEVQLSQLAGVFAHSCVQQQQQQQQQFLAPGSFFVCYNASNTI